MSIGLLSPIKNSSTACFVAALSLRSLSSSGDPTIIAGVIISGETDPFLSSGGTSATNPQRLLHLNRLLSLITGSPQFGQILQVGQKPFSLLGSPHLLHFDI